MNDFYFLRLDMPLMHLLDACLPMPPIVRQPDSPLRPRDEAETAAALAADEAEIARRLRRQEGREHPRRQPQPRGLEALAGKDDNDTP